MQTANLKLPAEVPRIHPLSIKEGAILECTKSAGRFYTVGKLYKVMNISTDERAHFPVSMQDDMATRLGHSWSIDSLAGLGDYTDYGTQFKLVVWTKQ